MDRMGKSNERVYRKVSGKGQTPSEQQPSEQQLQQARQRLPLPRQLNTALGPVPAKQSKTAMPEDLEELVISVNLDGQSLLNGLIMSEVLGRPRCKRRGRW